MECENSARIDARWRVAAAAAALVLLATDGARAGLENDHVAHAFRDNTVRIEVKWPGRSSSGGFGFVAGERDGFAYVATAWHVVAKDHEKPESIELTFLGGGRQQALVHRASKERDIAILKAVLPDGQSWCRPGVRDGRRHMSVWFVGREGKWWIPTSPGIVNQHDPIREVLEIENLGVVGGSSGAPLLSSDGITGMVITDVPGSITEALTIHFIEEAFGYWEAPFQLRTYSAAELTQTQQALAERGLYDGPLDGQPGDETLDAIRAFQKSLGAPETGMLTVAQRVRLGEAPPKPVTTGLTGTWRGRYHYRDDRPSVSFELVLIQKGGAIAGKMSEPNTFPQAPRLRNLNSTISGRVEGVDVSFRKTYDGEGGVDHYVDYAGQLDAEAETIRGEWRLSTISGRFEMQKVPMGE